ncbi:MAG: SMP-30/gluconolactonase/LRE family protein [Alphaproteobacteria bacterium]|nr:SMP-30/gluconolactonase/LRE family protein [Alphaproteobacteria bacterium]
MYAPAQELEAKVFAQLPPALSKQGTRSWMTDDRPDLRDRIGSFLEGPAFDRAGTLYLTDLAFGRILKLSPAGEFAVVHEYDGRPNGIAIHKDGGLFIADRAKGILRLDPGSGKLDSILPELPNAKLHGPNDLTFASTGDLYFTDQGETGLQNPTGRLVRLRAGGQVEVLLDRVPSPNGLALNKAERAVLLAVTRANAIWHVILREDAQLVGRTGIFVQLSGGPGGGPDGIALDAEDNLAIAHVQMGTAWLFSALGEPLYRMRSPAGRLVTNMAFGGADGRTLFITESATGTVFTARLPAPGATLFSHL